MRIIPARDLDQWMYPKQSPFPGAWLAPLRLPGLRGFWANVITHGSGLWTNLARMGALTNLVAYSPAQVSTDIATTWPGAIAPYFWITDGADGVLNINTQAGDTHIAQMQSTRTFGGWFKMDTLDEDQHMMWWSNAAGDEDCTLKYLTASNNWQSWISSDRGTTVNSVTYSDSAVNLTSWNFIVQRFQASTELVIRHNGGKATTTTSIIASTLQSDYFQIFPYKNVTVQSCPYCAQAWVAAYAVSDAFLDWLYYVQRPLFGLV